MAKIRHLKSGSVFDIEDVQVGGESSGRGPWLCSFFVHRGSDFTLGDRYTLCVDGQQYQVQPIEGHARDTARTQILAVVIERLMLQ